MIASVCADATWMGGTYLGRSHLDMRCWNEQISSTSRPAWKVQGIELSVKQGVGNYRVTFEAPATFTGS